MTQIPNAADEFEHRFPDVAEAFRKFSEDQRKAMFQTATGDALAREEIYYTVRAAEKVRDIMVKTLLEKHIQAFKDEHAATQAKSG